MHMNQCSRHYEQAAFSEFKYNFTTFQQNIAEKNALLLNSQMLLLLC